MSGFKGFSGFSTPSQPDDTGDDSPPDLDEVYQGNDGEARNLLKGISKKDVNTKRKNLEKVGS